MPHRLDAGPIANPMTRSVSSILIGKQDLGNLRVQLQDLCDRCAEDNAYYAPDYLNALLETVAKDSDVKFLACWANDALVGFLPVVVSRLRMPGFSVAGSALQTLYNYSCTPLVDRDCVDDVVLAMINGLSLIAKAEWTIPTLHVDGVFGKAIARHLGLQGRPFRFVDGFDRAVLLRDDNYKTHLEKHVAKDLRKNLARRRRRLEELGTVAHQIHESGPGLAQAVESFLSIESSGWKGKRGTAMATSEMTQNLARQGFAKGKARADLLVLNDKPIAAVMSIFSGQTGFTVKMAYDDAYAKFSASRLLEMEILRDFLDNGIVQMLDSSTDGSHMIDDFWPTRQRMGTLVFSLASTAPRQRLKLYLARHAAQAKLKSKVKAILKRDDK
jgi:CelD/BcsL family acetyltransferase involved in cellulose biosynthesis